MAKKPPLALSDWDAIEAEYRAGQLTVIEIGRRFGVSHTAVNKRAKKHGWLRDLTERVRLATEAKLIQREIEEHGVSSEVSKINISETVERASERGATVVLAHRRDIARLRRIGAILAERLEQHLSGEAVKGPGLSPRESAGSLLETLSRANTRVIQLERQAFNLNRQPDMADARSVDLRRFSDDALDKIEALISEVADDRGDPSGEDPPEG